LKQERFGVVRWFCFTRHGGLTGSVVLGIYNRTQVGQTNPPQALASIAFSAFLTSPELLRGSFSRAFDLPAPDFTELQRNCSNYHSTQTPDNNTLDCRIFSRQTTITKRANPLKSASLSFTADHYNDHRP
jgi:hypothetical protein